MCKKRNEMEMFPSAQILSNRGRENKTYQPGEDTLNAETGASAEFGNIPPAPDDFARRTGGYSATGRCPRTAPTTDRSLRPRIGSWTCRTAPRGGGGQKRRIGG